MTRDIATQIAALINSQNQLVVECTLEKVLAEEKDYLWEMNADLVIGTVRIRKIQWYQAEISHLSVHPDRRRSGIGTKLLKRAEGRAVSLGACIMQCTIREFNAASIGLFTKHGFISVTDFFYPLTGNTVKVFQRSLR